MTQNKTNSKKPFKLEFLHPKYWGIWLLFALFIPVIYLPLSIQFLLGKWIGLLILKLASRRRNITLVNLKLAFPNKSADEWHEMARQVFINQGIGIFESLCAWFRPHVFDNCSSIQGLNNLKDVQENDKAILLLGAHYTMLDLGGLLCTQHFDADTVYRPQNNKLLEWFIFNSRQDIFGSQISHKNMRELVNNIKEKHIIWYTPDQDYGLKQGIMAEFFGIPAATITASRRLAKLGDKTNPPAVMAVHFYRTSSASLGLFERPSYQITITPVLDNYPSDDELHDAVRVNKLLENLICIAPTQWMWFHKRFKTNQTGRTNYYD